jgi:hypothetical protein
MSKQPVPTAIMAGFGAASAVALAFNTLKAP